MRVFILFAFICSTPLFAAVAQEELSDEERAFILDQVALCEQSILQLDESTAYFARLSVADVLIEVGEMERAIEIINQYDDAMRRFVLTSDGCNALRIGDDAAALRLYLELEDLTWSDIVQIARNVPPGVSLEPFERLLPDPPSTEQRWIIDTVRVMQNSHGAGSPQEWLACYENGLELPGQEDVTWKLLNQLWCYAITFPEHAYDEAPWQFDEYVIALHAESAAEALFAHGLYDQAFQLASTLPEENRSDWIRNCVNALKSKESADFPPASAMLRMFGGFPDDVTRLLVAAAIGNSDWSGAVECADSCLTEDLRIELLRDVLEASSNAGVYVPEIREFDLELIEDLDYALLRVNLLRSDQLIGDEAKLQEHVDALATQFASPQYVKQHDLAWIAPFVAQAGVKVELSGVHELVHECELSLDGDTDGLLPFADVHVAEAYLILGDRESFLRMYESGYTADPPVEDAERNQALYGLRNWLRTIPDLRERITTLEELQLGAYGDQARMWTINDWLEDQGLRHEPPSIW